MHQQLVRVSDWPVAADIGSAPHFRRKPLSALQNVSTRFQLERRSTLLAQVLASNALAVTALVFIAVIALRLNVDLSGERAALVVPMIAVAFSLSLNIFILRRQFAPLDKLIATMDAIDLSNPGARADHSTRETTDIAELVDAFNEMIERLERERRKNVRAAVNAQEKERARVARDLHDEVNQALTAILLRLEAASMDAPPKLASELAEAKQLANQAMEELLQLARRLRPTALDHGLDDAVGALVRDFGRTASLKIELEKSPDQTVASERMDPEAELAFYRVAQEALSNVAQHSNASNVKVYLGPRLLLVEDDGDGFDLSLPTNRYGLTGMRERALLVGGHLTISARPGKGTCVRLEIDEDDVENDQREQLMLAEAS